MKTSGTMNSATGHTSVSTRTGNFNDGLYDRAGARPDLDLDFARTKSLKDRVSKENLITFTRSSGNTGLLLDIIKKTHGVWNIGFYVTKRFKSWQMSEFTPKGLDWQQRDQWFAKFRSSMNKQRYAQVDHLGYDKYFMLNGKKLKVENVDLNGINDKMKSGGIRRIFAKSMKNRLQSRTLLNKFIDEVA